MNDEALSHVKVLDLTHYVAGPFCTKLLADYGAQVIKVEMPGRGDGGRKLGPFLKDQPHPEKSGTFLHLNTNKVGITLNLKTSTGVRIFKELSGWADVVVENFRPGVMERLGLSYSRLGGIKPELVMTSISNFGQTGPYRDYKATEMVEYAVGGPMLATGALEREPVKLPGRIGLYIAGQIAAIATLIAVYRRDFDGCGEYLDISIMETQASSIDRQSAMLLNHQYTGSRWSRRKTRQASLGGIYKCKDGYVEIEGRDRVARVMAMLGKPELVENPRFATEEARKEPENSRALHQVLTTWFSHRTKMEAWEEAQKHRVLSAPVYNIAEVLDDGSMQGRGFWTRVDRANVGVVEHPGRPFIMESTPSQMRRPAPLLGEHNDEVYRGVLGYSSSDLVMLRQSGVI